ncbi:MAG: thioredoxin [Lachnospiraceae bacterium]|nr:thioredoxin [Lachnospiraceae bacterium]
MEYVFTSDNFEEEVLKSATPVLVDFYADWCGPCKMMAPVVAELAEEYDGRLKVGKLNVDENPDLAQRYDVMSIPLFLFFRDGEVAESLLGGQTKTKLTAAADRILA